ncbi:MAG: hypothetical protein DBX00_08090 [Verrucomicrobia bacterium]|nr:MAG: hypothetical protein DBX00_08090 [Verrucomicrobiota bacterium]
MHVSYPLQGFTSWDGIADGDGIAYQQNAGKAWDVLYGGERALLSLGAARGGQASKQEKGQQEVHDRQSGDLSGGVKGAVLAQLIL